MRGGRESKCLLGGLDEARQLLRLDTHGTGTHVLFHPGGEHEAVVHARPGDAEHQADVGDEAVVHTENRGAQAAADRAAVARALDVPQRQPRAREQAPSSVKPASDRA